MYMYRMMNSINMSASMITWMTFIIMTSYTLFIMYLNKIILMEWTLSNIFSTPILFTIILDPIGTTFSSVILLISANVLSFSTIYMKNDQFINRFTIMVILFILSMNLMIFIPHMMILLLGWDGLGLVSFLLIIYYQNHKSLAAGLITALSNRIGDALILISISLTLDQGHWLIINMTSDKFLMWQSFLIMTASMTKSAQMPFSSWLPAAMAAPTPVSALVHSSTLVTAGVFLLIRFYPFLHSNPMFNKSMLIIATSTMLMASISATTECDMKKIIALSTLSQLGMMMASIGFNLPLLTFLHMVTHAMFKALLFICAGALINMHNHSQDLRWMGQLTYQMPITSSCMFISNMALCGFPFMASFYSKDLIMEMMLSSQFNMLMMLLTLFSIGLTSFYSIRFSTTTIMSPMNSNPWMNLFESQMINTPMIIMSLMATTSGAMLLWQATPTSYMSIIPLQMKMLPTLMMIMGSMFGYKMSTTSTYSFKKNMNHLSMYTLWFMIPLSTQFMMKSPFIYAHYNLKLLDHGWLETPQLINSNITSLNTKMINMYPKFISHILFSTMLVSMIMLLLYVQYIQ